MKNKWWIIFIFIVLILIFTGIYFFSKNKKNSNYQASRTSYSNETTKYENNTSAKQANNINQENTTSSNNQKKEELISSFSTKIYSKDTSRQNNIYITCSKLNNTTVPKGTTFSFCNTVGPATSDKGYQKADIFDNDGNKKKGLGGGNCQVSTTLYNAVLKIPSLNVTERHEHSNKVPYIKTGKDAAIAYGSYDFKFVNNCDFDIKINAEANTSSVNINLYKII